MAPGSDSIRVLAVDPTAVGPGRVELGGVSIHVERFPRQALARGRDGLVDLLALANLRPEDAARIAGRFQSLPGWDSVPVLYVLPPGLPGIILPPSYRPELDGFAIGALASVGVRARMRQFARAGLAKRPPVRAGRYRLDQLSGHLRWPGGSLQLTSREAEILGVLLVAGGRPVSADECAVKVLDRGSASAASLVRRHISNLRSRLHSVPGAPRIVVVKSHGYAVDLGRG